MNKSSLVAKSLVGVFALTTAGLLVAEDATQPTDMPHRTSSQSSQYRTDKTADTTTDASSSSMVQKVNKCSELIGMEVKNQQGEKLGKVSDVVIDFSRDRIAYVVLSTSTGTFSASKMHAIPLRAFQPGADGKSLTLNADRDKVANAEGFAKDEWPSPSNPSWGAQPFWQEGDSSRGLHNQQQNQDQYHKSHSDTSTTDKNQQQ